MILLTYKEVLPGEAHATYGERKSGKQTASECKAREKRKNEKEQEGTTRKGGTSKAKWGASGMAGSVGVITEISTMARSLERNV